MRWAGAAAIRPRHARWISIPRVKGVSVGKGRLPACLKAHMANLSAPCSAKLSTATTCEADVTHLCGNARSGGDRIAPCLQAHLREISNSCKTALAYIETLPSAYP
jgi:hypothetical protein